MEWWLWLAGGLALVVAELATPSGFFIIFFGIGALAVGVLDALGVVDAPRRRSCCCSACCPWSPCCCFAAAAADVRRRPPSSNVDSLIGELAIVQEPCRPASSAASKCAARSWSARNTSAVTLDPGQRARVPAVDGLTLAVIPE